MIKKFIVKVDVPTGVSIAEMKEYIKNAVAYWAGSGCPNDPIYNLNKKSVKVSLKRKVK